MLIDVKTRIDDVKVTELLKHSVFSDPRMLEEALNDYRTIPQLELVAFEEDGLLIGIIGFELNDNNIEIHHIAIDPYYRGMGYGRGIILELIVLKEPKNVIAETDEEAVDFYRNVGFTISSLGELYPGIERFQCEFVVEDTE